MLAGQPGKLNVTALRRDEAAPDTTTAPVAAASEAVAPNAETSDPIAAATAALDRADATPAADGSDAAPVVLDDRDPTPRAGETKRAARKRARAAEKAAQSAVAAAPLAEGDAAVAAPVPALDVQPLPDATAAASPIVPAVPSGADARVQIGIFSLEANAQRAVDKLKAGGISANLRKEESKGKTFWSVVANGTGGGKALLAKIKDLGFGDAYVVSG